MLMDIDIIMKVFVKIHKPKVNKYRHSDMPKGAHMGLVEEF